MDGSCWLLLPGELAADDRPEKEQNNKSLKKAVP